MNTTTTTEETTLAPIISALHKVYDDLSAEVAKKTGVQLPRAVFVIQRDRRAWGHITVAGDAWQTETQVLDEDYAYGHVAVSIGLGHKTATLGFHEIMVSGENLGRGGKAVFGTVAHEASHAYNIRQGIRDVDSNGRHNKKFKQTAEHLFGLQITKVTESIGWSYTEVPAECAKRWRDQIRAIDEAIATVARHPEFGFSGGFGGGFPVFGGAPTPTGRNKNLLKATCGCGSSIRASRKVLDKGITCDECEENFTPAE